MGLSVFGMFSSMGAGRAAAAHARRNALIDGLNAENASKMAEWNASLERVNQANREVAEIFNDTVREREREISDQFYRFSRSKAKMEGEHGIERGLKDVRKTRGAIMTNGNLSPDVLRSVVAEQMTEINFAHTMLDAQLRGMDFEQDVTQMGYDVQQRVSDFHRRIGAEASGHRQVSILMDGDAQAAGFRSRALDSRSQAAAYDAGATASLISGASSIFRQAYNADMFSTKSGGTKSGGTKSGGTKSGGTNDLLAPIK